MINSIKTSQTNTFRKLPMNIAIAGVLALSLTGCANYRDIHSDAKPRPIETFASTETFSADNSNAGGEWPSEQWWSAFGDTQLNALIDEALAYNSSLDAAAARVKAAQAYTGTARSALYPQIDGAADVQYQHFSEN